MKRKPYKAKTLSGAQAYARNLRKQLDHMTQLFESRHHDCLELAKLAADGPCFYNPLHAMEAKKIRDKYLRDWLKLNPDGTPLKQ